jgi:hypothetical protein
MIAYAKMPGNIFDQNDIAEMLDLQVKEIVKTINREAIPCKKIGNKLFLSRMHLILF